MELQKRCKNRQQYSNRRRVVRWQNQNREKKNSQKTHNKITSETAINVLNGAQNTEDTQNKEKKG